VNDRFSEQRIRIKFCEKLGKNRYDTYAVLSKAYGGEAIKKGKCFCVAYTVLRGRENMEDDERSGRPRCHRTDEDVLKTAECGAFR
jgi:hypothetical protein